MKKFILICIFPALAAILTSCANESGGSQEARQPDVFTPATEHAAPHA